MDDNLEKKYICQYCGKSFNKRGIHSHIWKAHTIDGQIHSKKIGKMNKNRPCWSKGLTKETDPRLQNLSNSLKNHYKDPNTHGTFYGRKHTEESKKKISLKMLGNHHNNIDKTGRGKKGYYKGFWCDSTYELAFIIYCLDHDINVERNKEYFIYEYNGKKHRYYPDFIIDDILYEIKGYNSDLVKIKQDAVIKAGRKYKLLATKDLKFVFDYIKLKYDKKVDKNISDLYTN